ncbi:MAG: GNAT family N-acetyltransferase [Nitrospira sp.]|nr:GNAT family N-acetyltransferase [Nitrospira sp.]
MDLFASISTQPESDYAAPPHKGNVVQSSLAIEPQQEVPLPPVTCYPAHVAATNEALVKLVSGIFNESFGFRPDGKPYRMGPKSVTERLRETDYLLIAGDECSGIGYLFGKEIPSSHGRIAWVESMAVLPLYRRNGIATSLVRHFHTLTKMAPRFGFATPNPIAALIATKEIPGTTYIGSCYPPYTVLLLLKEIRQNCFDLRGCHIDEEHFRIRTGFSPLSRSDQREWSPRGTVPEPVWWKSIEHLPNEFEALLVIEK